MDIYTMGFTKKSAKDFFELIKNNNIQLLVDVRLNNQSQLAGFTKGKDLSFFLNNICQCDYVHEIDCAPTKEILDGYKKKEITWEEYEVQYNGLIVRRKVANDFKKKYSKYSKVLLLCSEPTAEYCHRRLLAEYFRKEFECNVIHI